MGHSSTVNMWLHIGSEKLRVLQSSAIALKMEKADLVPRGDAVVEIIVDGRSHKHSIRVLPCSPRPNWVGIVDR